MSHCAIKLAAAEAQISPPFKGKQSEKPRMKRWMDERVKETTGLRKLCS